MYLFRAPTPVVAEINRELLILFCVKYPKVLGAVLYDPDSGTQDIADLLELCLKQLLELEIPLESIQLKVCGLSQPYVTTIARARKWIESKNLRVLAVDIGRFVKRTVEIDTEKGKLGVLAQFKHEKQDFLTTNSHQRRRRAQ